MKAPNPVQAVSQQRQQFHLGGMPPQSAAQPPQAMIGGGPPQALGQQVHDLAIEIYARLAVAHIADDHYTHPLSAEQLHALAKHSQTAAKAFFTAMGVQFND